MKEFLIYGSDTIQKLFHKETPLHSKLLLLIIVISYYFVKRFACLFVWYLL